MKVNFYEQVDDKLLKFAVIISRHNGQWVFCKHKDRNTYEIPGGHRELNEEILQTAKRELCEETGALQFDIFPICVYSVTGKNRVNQIGDETYGMLFFAVPDPGAIGKGQGSAGGAGGDESGPDGSGLRLSAQELFLPGVQKAYGHESGGISSGLPGTRSG